MPKKNIKISPLSEKWLKAFEKASPYRFAVNHKFSNHSSSQLDLMSFCIDLIQSGQSAQCLKIISSHPALLFSVHHGKTLLDAAWTSEHPHFALELLKVGAWSSLPQPTISTQPPASLSPPALDERLSSLHAAVAKHSPDALSLEMADHAIRQSDRPSLEWSQWVSLSLSIGSFGLANDICEHFGISPCLKDAQHFLRASPKDSIPYELARPLYDYNCDGRSPSWKLIEKSKDHLQPEHVEAIWRHAIRNDRIERMTDLVSWGIIPPQWTLSLSSSCLKHDHPSEPISLLAEAAIHGAPLAFACLKCIPEAILAAQAIPPTPKALSQASVQDLCALARLGVDIGSVDSDGRNVLHHWAINDRDQPRNGWISICKIKPELLHIPDAKGRTPVELQTHQLRHTPKRLLAFQAMISKIERSELSTSLSHATEAANAKSRSNPRL